MEPDRQARTAFDYQRYRARARGIAFDFTFLQWCAWWTSELAKLPPGAKRGRRRDEYTMCRFLDQGGYGSGNVYCATASNNLRDWHALQSPKVREQYRRKQRAAMAAAIARGAPIGAHLKGRYGEAHPRSKAVITPRGRFGSIAQAMTDYGRSRRYATGRLRTGEWRLAAATA